ncbi:MAG: restriction endonuclease [Chloroflexus sp.]|uniref:restriction endonuclease n=1 Tax=Chloroflexus sp. TaxID=1904827 RepID=UPI00404A900D
MTVEEFEKILDDVVRKLNQDLKRGQAFKSAKDFESRVREVLDEFMQDKGLVVDFNPHPHAFPDITLGEFGIEVKFTLHDTWRSVANSIVESTRKSGILYIYIVFGKMGGKSEVKWARYDDCVIHVRTTHVPRFEVEINSKRRSLFKQMGITYNEFSTYSIEQKMHYMREYARKRLKHGERLWWLEEKAEPEHSLPIKVRLYTSLPDEEKRMLRVEAALLCPQIVSPSGLRHKYDDVVLYLLTYHGVVCHQVRDLFSAGSVALRRNTKRGGIYIQRALQDIEAEMLEAAMRLDIELFEEYGGERVEPQDRIAKWLDKADKYDRDWMPSKVLFTSKRDAL